MQPTALNSWNKKIDHLEKKLSAVNIKDNKKVKEIDDKITEIKKKITTKLGSDAAIRNEVLILHVRLLQMESQLHSQVKAVQASAAGGLKTDNIASPSSLQDKGLKTGSLNALNSSKDVERWKEYDQQKQWAQQKIFNAGVEDQKNSAENIAIQLHWLVSRILLPSPSYSRELRQSALQDLLDLQAHVDSCKEVHESARMFIEALFDFDCSSPMGPSIGGHFEKYYAHPPFYEHASHGVYPRKILTPEKRCLFALAKLRQNARILASLQSDFQAIVWVVEGKAPVFDRLVNMPIQELRCCMRELDKRDKEMQRFLQSETWQHLQTAAKQSADPEINELFAEVNNHLFAGR